MSSAIRDTYGISGPEPTPAADLDEGAARFAALAARVGAAPGAFAGPGALADAAAVSSAALTDLLLAHAHMTPAAWLARERVRFAAARLAGSRDAVEDVARAAGFASGAQLRSRFLALMRLTPEDYRRLGRPQRRAGLGPARRSTGRSPPRATSTPSETAELTLRLPSDYRAGEILAYHGRDPQSPSERVDGSRLFKALATPDGPAVLEIALERPRATCRVHSATRIGPESVLGIHAMAVRMLGLAADVRGFEALAQLDPHLGPIVAKRRGLRLPLTPTTFDGLCWAIIGQQINLAFACSLRREMLALSGEKIGDMLAHPSPERLARVDVGDLTGRRFSRSKAEYLIDTARAVATGRLDVEAMRDGSAVAAERALTSLRGVGTWTARYVLMRGAGFADCAPVGDVALAAALQRVMGLDERPNAKEVEALMRPFAPHRSLATFHLWASLRDTAG